MENLRKIAQSLGKLGGQKSAQSRLGGKSKEEISQAMRKLRMSKADKREIDAMASEMVGNLNRNVTP